MKNISLFLALSFLFSCQQDSAIIHSVSLASVNPFASTLAVDEVNGKVDVFNKLNARDLTLWVKNSDNGLLKVREMDGVKYSLQYLPTEYMIVNDLKKNQITSKEYNARSKKYSMMEYYYLRIEIPGYPNEIAQYDISDRSIYTERIKYLSFGMQNDISLISENGDVIPCAMFHFERTYNITPYSTFLIGFEKNDLATKTFVYEDNLFNNGKMKFHWITKDQNTLPKLEII